MDQSQAIEIGSLEVVLENVSLPMGLQVNAVTLAASAVRLEQDPFRIVVSKPGTLTALILAQNLADFLNRQAPGGLRDFKVDLREGKIHVQATLMIMKAAAVCTLRIVDGRQLFVDLESVDVMGVGAKNMVQSQLEKINPVLDAAQLPVLAQLTSYEVEDGKLILYGNISPPTV